VIFTSDNGGDGPGRTVWNSTAGLRGWKRHLYEGGIRTPFIAYWPGRAPAGGTSDLLAGHVDILATACELAGVRPPAETDGVSILPTIAGREQSTKHPWLYWEIYEGPHPFQQAVRLDRWKGYRTTINGPLEVYDLRADPTEKTNVAAKRPEIAARIKQVMAEQHERNPNWQPTEAPAARNVKKKQSQ
jgi:arylsulfatase A-like enzyme